MDPTSDKKPDNPTPTSEPEASNASRRNFLKLSAAAAAAAAAGSPAEAMRIVAPKSRPREWSHGNTMPGRIILYHDPAMNAHGSIDKLRVEQVVHHGIQLLTGISETGIAMQSLFPGVHGGSTFAIKVNCIGPTDTRWEIARGIVSALSLMFSETYDVSQVTIYDRHSLYSHGYTTGEFTFNGNWPLITSDNQASGSGYYVWQDHELSQHLIDADFVINIPALKSHDNPENKITVALKNHYGSCHTPYLCGDLPGMLTLNADQHVGGKTGLVVTSGLRGTFNGGPGEPHQYWLTYPDELTPNMVFLSTDPVTNEYWALDAINAERAHEGHGGQMLPKICGWIEDASDDPYLIGVSDPEQMTVIRLDASDVDAAEAIVGGTFLTANAPNPFRDGTALRFRLEKAGQTRLQILDAAGRVVRHLGDREFAAGYGQVQWDGRDTQGRRVPAGVYFVRLEFGSVVRSRRVIAAH